jgi:uncharacterized repeat protein (TIGR01451 family)
VTVNVANNAAASLTNVATVVGGGEVNTSNDTASDPTTIVQKPDLTIAKTHTGNFTQGDVGDTYTITVNNVGFASSSGLVTVSDTLPAGLTPTAFSGTGWSTSISGQTVTATRSDALATGSSFAALTVTVNVANNAPSSVTNVGTVAGGGEVNTSNDTASDPTTIVQTAHLTITKDDGSATYTPGNNVSYTIIINNPAGSADAQNAIFSDPLPAGVTFVSLSLPAGWSRTDATAGGANGTITATLATLAAGSGNQVFTLVVHAPSSMSTNLVNTATVTSPTDPTPPSSTDMDTPNPLANLSIVKTGPGILIPGTNATYTITVSNTGPSDAQNVVLADTLPAGETLVSQTEISGPAFTLTGAAGGSSISDSIATLANGASATFQVTVAVASDVTAGSLANTASARSTTPGTGGSSTVMTPVLSLSTASGVVFDNTLENDGIFHPATDPGINGVTVILFGYDFLGNPVNLTTTTTTVNGQAGSYSFANLMPSDLNGYTVTETGAGIPSAFDDGLPGPAGNLGGIVVGPNGYRAVVFGAGQNAVGYNFAEFKTRGTVDLSLGKTLNPNIVLLPALVNTTFIVRNGGPDVATNVKVSDPFPDGMVFVSAFTPSQGVYDATSGIWYVGTLPVGGSATLSVVVQVIKPGMITNTAMVGCDQIDPILSNNVGSAEVMVQLPPDMAGKQPFLTPTAPTVLPSIMPTSMPAAMPSSRAILAVGAGVGNLPMIEVFDRSTGQMLFEMEPFPSIFRGGVHVAQGDVNGDGVPDIIAAAGPGGGPQVVVYDGKTGQMLKSFYALPAGFTGGINLAVGDVNGDGKADIIVGAGAGGGPQVAVYDGGTFQLLTSFYAYSPTFRGGVTVAAGDVNGDGFADIITGAGAGGSPQVNVFDGRSFRLLNSFFALSPLFGGGINVAAGDVNGDGKADIIIGAGAGGGPQVTVFDGATRAMLSSFYADDPTSTAGVVVAAADETGNGTASIITAPGAGRASRVRAFALSGQVLDDFYAFAASFTGGTSIAGARRFR